MEEIWKDIENYEGLYQVSNLGRVKRILFINNMIIKPSNKILSSKKLDNLGYCQVSLCKNGNRKYFRVHRLVAQAFIPNPNDLHCVNHKDGNKHNNNVNNLEWCTHSQNTRHAMQNGLFDMEKFKKATRENIKRARQVQKLTTRHSRAKLQTNDVIEIRNAYDNNEMSNKELSEKYGISISQIRRITSRRSWTRIS